MTSPVPMKSNDWFEEPALFRSTRVRAPSGGDTERILGGSAQASVWARETDATTSRTMDVNARNRTSRFRRPNRTRRGSLVRADAGCSRHRRHSRCPWSPWHSRRGDGSWERRVSRMSVAAHGRHVCRRRRERSHAGENTAHVTFCRCRMTASRHRSTARPMRPYRSGVNPGRNTFSPIEILDRYCEREAFTNWCAALISDVFANDGLLSAGRKAERNRKHSRCEQRSVHFGCGASF